MYAAIGAFYGKKVMWSMGATADEALDEAVRVWGIPRSDLRTSKVPQSAVERYQEGNYAVYD